MSIFSYNSKHKLIIGILIIGYAVYHFNGKRTTTKYYESGKTLQSGNFKNGKNHGLWLWYYPSGKRKMEGNFNLGKREGKWFTYNTNGSKASESNYVSDKLNGDFLTFDGEGKLIQTISYIDDTPVSNNN